MIERGARTSLPDSLCAFARVVSRKYEGGAHGVAAPVTANTREHCPSVSAATMVRVAHRRLLSGRLVETVLEDGVIAAVHGKADWDLPCVKSFVVTQRIAA